MTLKFTWFGSMFCQFVWFSVSLFCIVLVKKTVFFLVQAEMDSKFHTEDLEEPCDLFFPDARVDVAAISDLTRSGLSGLCQTRKESHFVHCVPYRDRSLMMFCWYDVTYKYGYYLSNNMVICLEKGQRFHQQIDILQEAWNTSVRSHDLYNRDFSDFSFHCDWESGSWISIIDLMSSYQEVIGVVSKQNRQTSRLTARLFALQFALTFYQRQHLCIAHVASIQVSTTHHPDNSISGGSHGPQTQTLMLTPFPHTCADCFVCAVCCLPVCVCSVDTFILQLTFINNIWLSVSTHCSRSLVHILFFYTVKHTQIPVISWMNCSVFCEDKWVQELLRW